MTSAGGADANTLQERAQKLLAADHFGALGISHKATAEQVREAFVAAAKAWHPDRIPAGNEDLGPLFAKVFARLNLAQLTLSDAAKRLKYVEELNRPNQRASVSDANFAEANLEFKKAEALLKKNDVAQAEVHLRRAVQLAPANADYSARLVSVLVKPTSPPDELKRLALDLDRILERDSACVRAYFYRGQLRKRLGLAAQANADFQRTTELDPTNIDAAREVRIYNMRKEKGGGPPAAERPDAKAESGEGVGGFFRKLFKR